MSKRSYELLEKLHPAIKADAIAAYKESVRITPVGVHPIIIETLRTFDRSNALYNQPWDGKDNDGDGKIDEKDEKVSNAKGGQSFHNYGLALDFALEINGKISWKVDKNWVMVADCFKAKGFKWGGDWKSFKDYPHVEKSLGYSTAQLLALHKSKSFIPGNIYVNV